jgi:hypothetical protein
MSTAARYERVETHVQDRRVSAAVSEYDVDAGATGGVTSAVSQLPPDDFHRQVDALDDGLVLTVPTWHLERMPA